MRRLVILSTLILASAIAHADSTQIKVGALLCFTGSCAADGQAALQGMELAVSELKSAHPELSITILPEDTAEATSAATAVSAFRKLYSSGVRIFIGPSWSSAAKALAPIMAKQSDIVVLTPSSGTPDFHLAGKNLFNLRGTDGSAVERTAEVARKIGVNTVGIFGSQQSWSVEQTETFEKTFIRLGGKVPVKVEPLPGETRLSGDALKLLSAKPEGVFISVFAESPLAVTELAAKRYSGKKFAAAVMPYLLEQAPTAFEGTIFTTFTNPSGVFADAYESRFKVKPLVASGGGYDAIMVIASSIPVDKQEELAKKILASKVSGAFGPITFDENGCVKREPETFQVVNQRITRYNPE